MRRMMIASVLLLLFAAPAQADQSVTLYLNWKPGPEHVPLLYAQKGGLYEQEGVHVTIEPGTGSGNTLRVVAKDPARLLWPALANGNGIDPQSVTWVNVSNNAKVDALRSGAIDIAVNAFPDSFRFYGLVVPYRQHGIVRGDCSHRRPVCRRPGSAGVHGDR